MDLEKHWRFYFYFLSISYVSILEIIIIISGSFSVIIWNY